MRCGRRRRGLCCLTTASARHGFDGFLCGTCRIVRCTHLQLGAGSAAHRGGGLQAGQPLPGAHRTAAAGHPGSAAGARGYGAATVQQRSADSVPGLRCCAASRFSAVVPAAITAVLFTVCRVSGTTAVRGTYSFVSGRSPAVSVSSLCTQRSTTIAAVLVQAIRRRPWSIRRAADRAPVPDTATAQPTGICPAAGCLCCCGHGSIDGTAGWSSIVRCTA